MKTKTIKQVLRKKFDDFLKSIDDPVVKKLVKDNSIITGGCIASMLKGEPVNDFDVYFTNRETVLAVANYYIKKFKSVRAPEYCPSMIVMEEPIGGFTYNDGDNSDENSDSQKEIDPNGRIKIRVTSSGIAADEDFKFDEQEELPPDSTFGQNPSEKKKRKLRHYPEHVQKMTPKDRKKWIKKHRKAPYRPVYISSNAITLAGQMQLIIRFYGDAKEIHSNYDFAHCTCWWSSDNSHLELPSEALECLLTNELRYKGSKYPLASIIRARKFINRGMTINAGQYLKMCMQLNDLDLRNINVLEDQLIGVDALYFAQMLNGIPKEQKIDNKIDSAYLITMIDRFF